MENKEPETRDLLWSCFVNWVNTLEKFNTLEEAKNAKARENAEQKK